MTYAMSARLEVFDLVRMQTLTSVVVVLDGAAKLETVRDALGTGDPAVIAVGLGKQPLDAAQKRVAQWTTRNAVRDCIEACSAYLEDSFDVALQTALKMTPKAFARLGFPEKLEGLAALITIDAASRERVLTVNRARNCLVHRRGIVSEKECLDGAAELVVQLEAPRLVEVSSPRPGVVVIGDRYYGASDVAVERRFALGSEVHFSVEDLIAVWTVVRKLVLGIDRALAARGAYVDQPA